jgi:hypothetical protein
MVVNCPTPQLQIYINLMRISKQNKNFCKRCHWHRMYQNRRLKSRILCLLCKDEAEFKKGFIPWIRGTVSWQLSCQWAYTRLEHHTDVICCTAYSGNTVILQLHCHRGLASLIRVVCTKYRDKQCILRQRTTAGYIQISRPCKWKFLLASQVI